MPIEDIEPGTSPEAPGNWYFYKQGSATSTGTVISSEGDATFAGTVTAAAVTQTNPTPAWININKYGASPSASAATNDTAIAAALAAMPATGGTLYIPAGAYSISTAIAITSDNISVRGDGMNATRITQTGADQHGISIIKSGPRYCTISDLQLTGTGSGTGDGIHIETTTATASASCDISHVFISNFGNDGVNTKTLITSTFTDVRVNTSGRHGFVFSTGTSIVLNDCYANGVGQIGYWFNQTAYSALNGCAADTCGLAYYLQATNSIVLTGCGSEGTVAKNGQDGTSFKVSAGDSNVLVGCYSSGNNAIGYWLTNSASPVALICCRETAPGGSATASMQVDSGCRATIVARSTATAASFAANTTNQIANNNFNASGATGSSVFNSDRTNNTAQTSTFSLNTAGTQYWGLQLRADSTNDLHIRDTANGTDLILGESRATQGNISLLTSTKDYKSGVGVILIGDRTTAPSGGNATAGSLLWSSSQRLTTAGNFRIATAGATLMIAEGSNACMGTATMVGGTVTVNTTAVTANSRIQLTVQSLGTVTSPKAVAVTTRSAGTSFTITSADNTDTSVVAWQIMEPA